MSVDAQYLIKQHSFDSSTVTLRMFLLQNMLGKLH